VPEDAFFWIDIFAVAQCRTAEGKAHNKADVDSFEKVIIASRATWSAATPWSRPVPFGRVWCLYEYWKTVEHGNEFDLVMPPAEAADFEAAIAGDEFEPVGKGLAEVDMENATATKPEDRDLIFGLVKASVGFSKVNRVVADALLRWFMKIFTAKVERLPLDDDGTPTYLENAMKSLCLMSNLASAGFLDVDWGPTEGERGDFSRFVDLACVMCSKKALEACSISRGDGHPATMKWMDMYTMTAWKPSPPSLDESISTKLAVPRRASRHASLGT